MKPRPRMHAREREAFGALVRRCHERVYAAAYRILGNRADAEDATQQCFASAMGDVEGILGRSEPCERLAWLASRLALNLLRDAKNRKRNEEVYAMRRKRMEERSPGLGADEAAILSEELGALPEDLRLALVLRYQEGFRLAAVGELLGCAESTVHDRIRRGLERLGARLRRRGVGLAGLSLSELVLRHKEVAVPSGLKAQLLGLAGGKALGLSLLLKPLVLLPLGLVLAGLGGFAFFQGDGGGAKKPAQERAGMLALGSGKDPAVLSAKAEDPRAAVQGGRKRVKGPQDGIEKGAGKASAPSGILRGLVRDKDGRPLEGAEILATSDAFSGKFPLHEAKTKSARDGSFVLKLPVDAPEGLRYRLRARLPGFRDARGGSTLLEAGKEMRLSPLVLVPWGKETKGSYQLKIKVVDPEGRGLAKVRLRLARELPGKEQAIRIKESVGATDAKGEALLSGSFLGDKVLILDGRYTEWGGRRILQRFAVRSPGLHLRRVLMKPGLRIQGRVLGIRGEPVQGVQLRAYRPGDWAESMSAWTDKLGNFEIRGLGEGAYTLCFPQAGLAYSPFTLPGVQAGTKGLQLQLKSKYSSKDVGLHDAEIHGSFVDAKTGKGIALGSLDWTLHRIPEAVGDKLAWLRSLQADLVQPSPRQVALMGEPAKPSSRFHSVGLTPGWYAVVARAPDKAIALSAPIHLQGRQIASGVVLRLSEGASLTGRVLTPDGKPLKGALVRLSGEGRKVEARIRSFDRMVAEPGDRRAATWMRFNGGGKPITDAKGRFVRTHLPTGIPLRVNVFHKAYRPISLRGVQLKPGQNHPELVLRFQARR